MVLSTGGLHSNVLQKIPQKALQRPRPPLDRKLKFRLSAADCWDSRQKLETQSSYKSPWGKKITEHTFTEMQNHNYFLRKYRSYVVIIQIHSHRFLSITLTFLAASR